MHQPNCKQPMRSKDRTQKVVSLKKSQQSWQRKKKWTVRVGRSETLHETLVAFKWLWLVWQSRLLAEFYCSYTHWPASLLHWAMTERLTVQNYDITQHCSVLCIFRSSPQPCWQTEQVSVSHQDRPSPSHLPSPSPPLNLKEHPRAFSDPKYNANQKKKSLECIPVESSAESDCKIQMFVATAINGSQQKNGCVSTFFIFTIH